MNIDAVLRKSAGLDGWLKVESNLLLIVTFLFSFELPITEAAHALLAPQIGWLFLLFHPYTVLVIIALLHVIRQGPPIRHKLREISKWVALLIVGMVVGSINGAAELDLLSREIWFGCLSIWTFFTLAAQDEDNRFLVAFASGIACWATFCVLIYIYCAIHFYPTVPEMAKYNWSQLVLSMRAPGFDIPQWLPFEIIAGNVNKVANILVLGALLAAFLYDQKRLSLLAAIALYLPIGIMLLLTFSRGAFVVSLFLVGLVVVSRLNSAKWTSGVSKKGIICMSGMLLIPAAVSLSTPTFIHYWTNVQTVSWRIGQWDSSLSGLIGKKKIAPHGKSVCNSIALGCGPGSYGETHFDDPNRTTHNLYLDTVFAAGLLGLLALLAICLGPLIKAWRSKCNNVPSRELFGYLGLITIMILSMREYDLAYLYATAMGGALIGTFAALSRRYINSNGAPTKLSKEDSGSASGLTPTIGESEALSYQFHATNH
jgi:hypothetical protein